MSDIKQFIESIITEQNDLPLAEIFEFRKYPKGFTFGPHSHGNLEINFVKKGTCKMKFDNEVVTFMANDCMVIFPGIKHTFFVENQPAELIQLEFSMDIFPELKADHLMEEHLIFLHNVLTHSQSFLKISMHKPLMLLIERIVDELSQKRENFMLLTRLYYSELFLIISRHLNELLKYTKQPNSDVLNKAICIIYSNYFEKITIEQIADECEISARYLRKLFEKEIGISPIEFISILRINRSKVLLHNFSVSIKEIAFSTGFENQQYFSKRFKQNTGISPLEYRKMFFRKM
ncbi:MAG TPA: AraC family transcriptional regulator [Bacteroidales bacterium]